MLCLPALTPVAKDAHAVGDSGECVVCSGNMPPPCASFEMFGSFPSSIHFFSRCGSIPSKPRMTSFLLNFDGPRLVPPEQAIAHSAAVTTATASSLTDLRMEIGRNYNSRMEQIGRDIRHALRRLRKAPAFTLFAVASLALGIGVCTAVYSAVRTLLWMPLGIPDASHLMVVAGDARVTYPAMSWPDFEDFRAAQTAARAVAAGATLRTAFRTGEVSQTVFGEAVSGQYFTVMGLRPRLGRLLDSQDEAAAARVAVLSESFWRTRLNADPGVIGRTISIGGQPFEVVGVIAGTFRGLELVRPA